MLVKGSFEDYFYILVGLVWVAFSIYKGMQKKKSQNAPGETVKKKSALETLMEEFLVKEEPVQPEPIVDDALLQTVESEEKSNPKVFSYDDIYEQSNYSEVSDVYDRTTETKNQLKTNLKTHSQQRKNRRFNLRKAVIYSEILNSRYF